MVLKRLKFLLTFILVCAVLTLMVIYSPRFSSAKSSSLVSYASTTFHDQINKGLGFLPSSKTLKTYLPDRFKWSNWRTSDAIQLEESLIHHTSGLPSNLNHSNSFNSKSNSNINQEDKNYHSNGLYYISIIKNKSNQNEEIKLKRHPILELIENSEKIWNEKLKKNSKNLNECVKEYRRRYKRLPPYGFEKWFEFANKNNIILKDEYDQIMKDLKPFRAIEAEDLQHRSWVMSNERPETFTISLFNSNLVKISGAEGHLARAKDLANLIKSFSKFLPENFILNNNNFNNNNNNNNRGNVLNFTFTKHDQPAVQMSWYRKQKMIDLADVGEYLSPSDYIRPINPNLTNWANACGPNSALYRNESNLKPLEEDNIIYNNDNNNNLTKSFIFDHRKAMEVCDHPESMALHGFTSSPGTDNVELVPLFTFAKASTQSDILVTPLEQYSDTYIGNDPNWKLKKISKILWRGSTTGAEFKSGFNWKLSQRARLHFLSHKINGTFFILKKKNFDDSFKLVEKNLFDLNYNLLDISFSGGPVQCDPVTCDYMKNHIKFANTMGLDESYQYKYLIDVDGNGWSGRFHRLMSTKSLVFKSSIFPEWYTDRVQPWVHYIPLKVDYSDLYDLMIFFRGDELDGKDGHDELAEKIATAGKLWAAEHWRRVDMAGYMFRLILEWRRIMLRGTGAQLDFHLPLN